MLKRLQITMPSGSYVKVQTYTSASYSRQGTYMNIHVYPLRADAYHTTGLCGNYNLNSADDGPDACTTNCEAHRRDLFTFVFCYHYQLNCFPTTIYSYFWFAEFAWPYHFYYDCVLRASFSTTICNMWNVVSNLFQALYVLSLSFLTSTYYFLRREAHSY